MPGREILQNLPRPCPALHVMYVLLRTKIDHERTTSHRPFGNFVINNENTTYLKICSSSSANARSSCAFVRPALGAQRYHRWGPQLHGQRVWLLVQALVRHAPTKCQSRSYSGTAVLSLIEFLCTVLPPSRGGCPVSSLVPSQHLIQHSQR